jgi:hypothetical protein
VDAEETTWGATTVPATGCAAAGFGFTITLLTSFPVRWSLRTTLVIRTGGLSGPDGESAAHMLAAASATLQPILKQKWFKMFAPRVYTKWAVSERTFDDLTGCSGNPF